MIKSVPLLVAITSTLLVSSCISGGKQQRETREPEGATGLQNKQQVTANRFMVAAANPYATKAGQKNASLRR